ncbi:MAG: hypothetical protein HND47_24805 [Chloroflexi bacterium]|nr:hypothetical protein [Chloroflexota bacterium]
MIEAKIQSTHIMITDSVANIFMTSRQFHKDDNERGGIVLGQINESNNKILVCRATIPSNVDSQGKSFFRRNHLAAQYVIEYEFFNSDRKNTYLGEWHTHPTKTAFPSQQDISMIRQQFAENNVKVKFIFLFIVAHDELYVGMYNGNEINSIKMPLPLVK